MEHEEDTRSLPWVPVTFGVVLIIGVIVSAILLPQGKELTYQKPPSPTPTSSAPVAQAPAPTPMATTSQEETPVQGDIRIDRISPDPIANGTVIEGKAPGNWFFEASFPIELRDTDGKLLASAIAQAEGDWMTTALVPFRATLHFPPPVSASGTLIFKKDNPSGLPEHDDALKRDVSILIGKKEPKDATMYLGFISEKDAAEKDCTKILSAVRVIPGTPAIATKTIEELLIGPTIAEVGDGMLTIIPSGTKLNSLLIKNGIATADFNAKLTDGVAGSCKVGAIRAQIEETLKQFPSIQDVVISVNGVSEGILQP
jgi:hypothetical protein